jgi:hypothetical protein
MEESDLKKRMEESSPTAGTLTCGPKCNLAYMSKKGSKDGSLTRNNTPSIPTRRRKFFGSTIKEMHAQIIIPKLSPN